MTRRKQLYFSGPRVFVTLDKPLYATPAQIKRFDALVPPESRLDTFNAWVYGWFYAKPDATVQDFLAMLEKRFKNDPT